MTNKKDNPVCLRCSGPMEEGFIPEFDYRTPLRPGYWVEGKPVMKGNLLKKLDLSGKHLVIEAYRCQLCGYIELYANKET